MSHSDSAPFVVGGVGPKIEMQGDGRVKIENAERRKLDRCEGRDEFAGRPDWFKVYVPGQSVATMKRKIGRRCFTNNNGRAYIFLECGIIPESRLIAMSHIADDDTTGTALARALS